MKKNQIILIVVGFIFILGIGFSLIYWFQYVRPRVVVPEETEYLCTKFSTIEGEVSCQEAKEISLLKYPGEILKIDRITLFFPVAVKPPTEETEEKDVWILKINLKNPLNLSNKISLPPSEETISQDSTSSSEILVVVDRQQGDILSPNP